MYSSVDDYVRQTLDTRYGPDPIMRQDLRENRNCPAAGLRAPLISSFFPPPPAAGSMGGRSSTLKPASPSIISASMPTLILPMKRGFSRSYLSATRDGFKLYEPELTEMVQHPSRLFWKARRAASR